MKKSILLTLMIVVVLISCELPNEFKGFEWEVELIVPLMNKTYSVYDLESGENFSIEDTLLVIFFEGEVTSEEVGNNLYLSENSSETEEYNGLMEKLNISLSIDESGIGDKDIDVTYAIVDRGIFLIELSDTSPKLNELNIQFLDIITPENKCFEMKITDVRDSVYATDVSGYYIGDEQSTTVLDSLNFLITSINDPTDEKLANIRIYFEEPLYFEYFRGYLTNRKIDIENQIFYSNINYPQNISNAIELEKALLEFSFLNEIGFDARLTGDMIAINEKDKRQLTLNIKEQDNIILRRSPEFGQSLLSKCSLETDDLVKFLNICPEIIKMENISLSLGNMDNEIGFAHKSNRCQGNYKISSPSIFKVNHSTITPDTVYVIEINKENQKHIGEYPQHIELSFVLENTTYLGANIDIFFSSSADTLYLFQHIESDSVQAIVFTDNFVGPSVNTEPGINKVSFLMKQEDLNLFLNEQVFFAIKMTFEPTADAITIRPEHYIKIAGRLNICAKVRTKS